MSKNLWVKESDRYTDRAIELHDDKLYGNRDQIELSNNIYNATKTFNSLPREVLDIGCAFGGTIFELKNKFEHTRFFGIDPGQNSIELANKNLKDERISFLEGFSDDLPFQDNKFDIVILTYVLQWIPRNLLIKTISEVDRVVKNGGLVYIEEYLPNKPITSKSHHHDQIYIFKDNYSEFFTVYPWFKEVYRRVIQIENGEDQQRNISVIRKYNSDEVYVLKKGQSELHENLFSSV